MGHFAPVFDKMEASSRRRNNLPNLPHPQQVTVIGQQVATPATDSGSPGGESAAASSGISTLSISHRSTPTVNDEDTARPSIFDDVIQQPERYEESDDEEIANYPDDDSAGSTSSDFNLLSTATDDVLGCRFLFAKEEDKNAGTNDMRNRGDLEKKHCFIL